MKEMVGGCCVCSDERGWTENPLVYCDGQGCTVAVHQACYGIVTVPSGPWFCRKCESQERAARVRCELCPSKDGALKKTDNSGWAHVVCALYIPEVRFGNVSTMEPIILSMVPTDRFNKACYICEGQGRESKSKFGACMQCNKAGCKQHFHVTCAQALGLLCEEAGNYMDNVKYCGYCQHHYSKLKKGSNVKTIPAFKPLPAGGSASDSPDKLSPSHSGSAWGSDSGNAAFGGVGPKDKQRKKGGRKSNSLASPKAGNNRDSTNSSVIVDPSNATEESKTKSGKSDPHPFADVLAGVGLMPGPRTATSDPTNDAKNERSETAKVEIIKSSESVSAKSGNKKQDRVGDSAKTCHSHSGFHEPPAPSEMTTTNIIYGQDKGRSNRRKGQARSVTPISGGGNDTESTLSNVSDGLSGDVDGEKIVIPIPVKIEHPVSADSEKTFHGSVIMSSSHASVHPANISQSASLSLPAQPVQRTVSPIIIASASGGKNSHGEESNAHHISSLKPTAESGPVLQVKKSRKGGRTPKAAQPPMAPDSPPSSPDSAGVGAEQPAKRRKKSQRNAEPSMSKDSYAIPDPHPVHENLPNHFLLNSTPENLSAKENQSIRLTTKETTKETARESSKELLRESSTSAVKENTVLNLLTEVSKAKDLQEPSDHDFVATKETIGVSLVKDNQILGRIANGINAPHMLGNQINPTSNMAQKMTDTLAAELEDHQVYSLPPSSTLVGVPFPCRPVSPSTKVNATTSGTPFPQSLEQLLERQWEQGSQFLMEQAQHFDIASLLSCLHNLRQENMRLEDHVASLNRRREHLLAVNARLSVPLALHPSQSYQSSSNSSIPDRSTPGPPSGQSLHASPQERNSRGFFLPQSENGLPENLASYVTSPLNQHGSRRSPVVGTSHQVHNERVIPSPVIVTSRMNPSFHPVPPSANAASMISSVPGPHTMEGRNLSVLRSTSSTPEMRSDVVRTSGTPSQQYHPAYQIVSPPPQPSHHSSTHSAISSASQHVVAANQHNLSTRREAANDSRHPISRPSPIERR